MCSRKAWLLKPWSATTHCGAPGKRSRRGTAWGSSWAWPGARMKATARPSPSAITHALVPPDQVRGRLRPHANGPALHAHRAPCCWPPFFRPGRLVVSPDAGAVQKRHPELDPVLLGQEQQPLPDTQVGPADEHLSRPRPGPQVRGDGAPLGPVLMPPDDRRDCTTEILGRGLALGPARLDQRLQVHPCSVRQHRPLLIPGGAKRPPPQSVQARTGPSPDALKAIRQTIRRWAFHHRTDKSLE